MLSRSLSFTNTLNGMQRKDSNEIIVAMCIIDLLLHLLDNYDDLNYVVWIFFYLVLIDDVVIFHHYHLLNHTFVVLNCMTDICWFVL
uniref:Ovule protein n=1 Tax=Schistosoma curassoni TaxID=6186 RepID=A0A183KQB6_9TREM